MFAKYFTAQSLILTASAIPIVCSTAIASADPLTPMVSTELELERFIAPYGVVLQSAEESADRLFSDSRESTHLVSPELHVLRGAVDAQSLARFQGTVPHSTEASFPHSVEVLE